MLLRPPPMQASVKRKLCAVITLFGGLRGLDGTETGVPPLPPPSSLHRSPPHTSVHSRDGLLAPAARLGRSCHCNQAFASTTLTPPYFKFKKFCEALLAIITLDHLVLPNSLGVALSLSRPPPVLTSLRAAMFNSYFGRTNHH